MSWSGLIALGVALRPFENPPASGGTPSPFEASFGSTLTTLARELEMLEVEYRLTDKSRALLAHDVMDNAVYWGTGADAREAAAIARGATTVGEIACGVIGAGTFPVTGDALEVDMKLTRAAMELHELRKDEKPL